MYVPAVPILKGGGFRPCIFCTKSKKKEGKMEKVV